MTPGALPRLRLRKAYGATRARPKGSPPVERASLARPKGSPPVERCLACEAERGRHPWSAASLARPIGVATRGARLACEADGVATRGACLACEAVVSKENDLVWSPCLCRALSFSDAGFGASRLLCPVADALLNWLIQSVEQARVSMTLAPCSPRPRKRGTLHGWRPLSASHLSRRRPCEGGSEAALHTSR